MSAKPFLTANIVYENLSNLTQKIWKISLFPIFPVSILWKWYISDRRSY